MDKELASNKEIAALMSEFCKKSTDGLSDIVCNFKKRIEDCVKFDFADYSNQNIPFIMPVSTVGLYGQKLVEIMERKSDHDDFAAMNVSGFSDSAKIIFDIVKTRPSNSNEAVRISCEEYSDECSDAALEYGLNQLRLSGFVSNFTSLDDGSYVVFFTDRGMANIGSSNPLGRKSSDYSPAVLIFLKEYPEFEDGLDVLIANGFMKIEEGYFVWLKSKKCLAEYLDHISHDHQWKVAEDAFQIHLLKESFNNSCGQSKDFSGLRKLLGF